MIKGSKNKQITEKTKGVKGKIFMFPGNPPVSVRAKDQEEAQEKYKKIINKQ